MEELKKIQMEYDLPVQSHLSENKGEIDWVKELCPWSEFYGDAYDHFGMFGSGVKTIMAHCVWPPEKEIQRMRDNGVYVAHCPQSNTNLSSGIAPVRTYLEQGIPTGLGTDVAGGAGESVFRAMADCHPGVEAARDWWMRHASPLRQRRHSTWEQRAAADSSERPEALRKDMS